MFTGDDFVMYANQIGQCAVYGANIKGITGQIDIFEFKIK